MAAISDPTEQERLANLVTSQGLSVRNLERAIATAAAPAKAPPAAPSAHLADVEKSLSRALGMRVQMRAVAGKGRGRLVIHYGSLDQFDELLGRLGVKLEEI